MGCCASRCGYSPLEDGDIEYAADRLLASFDYGKLKQVDDRFRKEIQCIIDRIQKMKKNNSRAYLITGGSTVEGAAISRFFQPTVDGGNISKNREVEVDMNLVIAEIPKTHKHIVEGVAGKPINAHIACTDELIPLISEEYVDHFKKHGQFGTFVNSYEVKELASRAILFSEEEAWLKALLALAKDRNVADIAFFPHGEYVKPTAAIDIPVEIDNKEFLNISLDLSIMIKVFWFPEIATPWITRKRHWPTAVDIDRLSQHSFLISKPSDEEKLNRKTEEFSFSFHHIESWFAQNRTIQQQNIYAKYKSLIYKFVKPLHADIPSFFGKTVMIWAQENHPPNDPLWESEDKALVYLFQKLKEAFEKELDYFFVPSFNIMKKFDSVTKQTICKRLNDIKENLAMHLNQLPVDECVQFYGEIVDDCARINQIMDLKDDQNMSNVPRIFEEQFTPLRNRLKGTPLLVPQSTTAVNEHSAFVGRTEELKKIHQLFEQGNERTIVIHGIGGMGKTELARQFVYRHAGEYDHHFWINAETSYTTRQKLNDIGAHLKIFPTAGDGESMVTEMMIEKIFVACSGRNVLFVFDNIEETTTFCSWVEKVKANGVEIPYILGTSQSSDFASIAYPIPLSQLPEDISIQFLRDNITPPQFDHVVARDVVKLVGCHPLALQVAVAYMRRNAESILDYKILIDNDRDMQMYRIFPPMYGKSMYSTFNITYQSIIKRNYTLTVELLNIVAFLDGKNIERALLWKIGEAVCRSGAGRTIKNFTHQNTRWGVV